MSAFYEKMIRRTLFGLDAETAHEFGIESLRVGLGTELAQRAAAKHYSFSSFGRLERFGLVFANPLGMAAGFDKNGVVVNQLAALGFGFVEVGTVTFRPQKGNDKPRLFRLPQDQALINRLGFNNDGAEVVAERLKKLERRCVVGVNIGKNKDVPNEEAVENYLATFDSVHPVADYIAVNISSPNTPGLRDLQRGESLEELIGALVRRNSELASSGSSGKPKPLLVKIAPDLSEGEIETIVDVCISLGLAGIIATNTTISRDGLRSQGADQLGSGGLSGRPLAHRSSEVIRKIYRHSGGRLPIIGVGGIFTAQDAFDKIAAGASLLQAYTGFVYSGPSFARDINRGLAEILKDRGFDSLDDAVGSGS
jgi:dihydroorotate dehydrogenase